MNLTSWWLDLELAAKQAPFELNDVGLKVAVSKKSDRQGGRGLFPGSGKHLAGVCSLDSDRLS